MECLQQWPPPYSDRQWTKLSQVSSFADKQAQIGHAVKLQARIDEHFWDIDCFFFQDYENI